MTGYIIRAIFLYDVIQIIAASIAGVTYMDHFDFEERYRNANECNPFHWHPLHLPKECVQMFENLLRSRLQTLTPLRIVKERSAQWPVLMYPYNYVYSPIYSNEYKPEVEYSYLPVKTNKPSQYEILYELLKRDVQDLPSVPFLGISPYLGVIAMYKQPVSYKSAAMLKKLARVYDSSDLFKIPSGVSDNKNITDIPNKQKRKIKSHKKIENGNLVVDRIIENNDGITLLKIKKL